MSGHTPWRAIRRKRLDSVRVDAERPRQERIYNRPWWRLVRLLGRARGRVLF